MSTDEDRERRFDALLRQNWPPLAPNDSSSCVDDETLAAWSDGALTRDAARVVEAHAAGCARCQAMLAAFVRSSGADAGASLAEAPEPFWRRWHLRWLVPIAATATAVAVWVAMPTERPASRSAPTALVRIESPTVAEPQAAAPARSDRPISSAPATAPAAPRRDVSAPPREEAAAPAAPKALAEAPANVDSATALEKQDREAQAQVADAAAAGRQAPEPPSLAPAGSAAESRARTFAFAETGQIVSPDPQRRWRIAAPGRVEYSTTGGREWRRARVLPVSAGEGPVLLAGSAPAPDTCWIVGRAGIVLRSTDGVTFIRVASPVSVDVTAVRAEDARRATITTADGRTFVTSNAGETWGIP